MGLDKKMRAGGFYSKGYEDGFKAGAGEKKDVTGKKIKVILFGAGPLLTYAAQKLAVEGFEVNIFTAKRHNAGGIVSDDINTDSRVEVTNDTIGISIGSAWTFRKEFITRFEGRLYNIHGSRLPENRGGGGFSWRIMQGDRDGACLIHLVDEGIDTGDIIKYRKFLFPFSCVIPQDFFDYQFEQDKPFLDEFMEELKAGKKFKLIKQDEGRSTYWPRLNTLKHGFIDWRWDCPQLEQFIDAFDEPYCGASTFLNGERVFLKDGKIHFIRMSFHPFQSGIIYAKTTTQLWIAATSGSLIIGKVCNKEGKDITSAIKLGDRFHTPIKYLEEAKMFRAIYTLEGLK